MGTLHTSAFLRFARRWFDERTVANVFEPLLADHQREWLEAPHAHRAWIAMRTAAAFLVALLWVLPRAVLVTPTPAPVARRVVSRVVMFTIGCAILIGIPMLLEIDPLWLRGMLVLYALPAAITFALPVAVSAAVDAIRGDEALPPHVQRAIAVKLAAAGCLAMFLLLGWGVSAANQQWRIQMWRAIAADRPAPQKGVRELTIVELITAPALATAHEAYPRREMVQREINNRFSLILLPIAMVWMRWRLLDLPRRRVAPLPLGAITVACLAGFVLLRWSDDIVEHALSLEPGAGAWLPLMTFGIVGAAMQWWTSRRQETRADVSAA